MLLIWMLLAADGGCSGDTTLAPVRGLVATMAEAVKARDIGKFNPAWDETSGRVECLTEVVKPTDAAALHASRYLHHAITNDEANMAFALRAMYDVPGGGGKPTWLELPDGAEIAQPSSWEKLQIPSGVTLIVDGIPMDSRPLDRPAIYQALDGAGAVIWTHYLSGQQDLPAGYTLAPPSEGLSDGEAELQLVKNLLAEGQYEAAINAAMPAGAKYPELADAFDAAASLAADQLRRDAQAGPQQFQRDTELLGDGSVENIRGRRGAARRNDPRKGPLFGFEVGLPTSVRAEWKIGAGAVDAVGARLGVNLLTYGFSSSIPGLDTTVYIDTNLRGHFQLEFSVGVFFDAYGSAYGMTGASVQYDPPNALQFNLGFKVTGYGYFVPDLSVGFLW